MLIAELQEQRNTLMTQAAAIVRDPNNTEEQRAQADKMFADVSALEARIAQLERIEAHEAQQRAFTSAQRGNAQTEVEQRTRATSALRSFMLHNRVDTEYRDILTTGASGEATIPQLFNPELDQAMRAYAPILDIVDVRVTPSNGAPMKMSLVNYTGVTLPVVPEGTEFPEIDPAFTSQMVQVDKLGGQVKISAEELEDSSFDLASWLTQTWGMTFGISLESYVTNGDGANIASLLAAATAGGSTAVAGKLGYPDIAELSGALTQAYARNASFMMSTSTRAALIGLVATTGVPIFNQNPASDPFSEIFGKPVVINDSMPGIASGNKAVLFGDFKRAYLLRTTGQYTVKRLNERYADTDEVGFIIRARVGGVAKNAGISPLVALAIQ